MKKLFNNIRVDFLLLALIIPFLIIWPTLVSWIIIVYAGVMLASKRVASRFEMSGVSKSLILYYLINLCSVFWANEVGDSYLDIQVKLSLLFFPIVIGFSNYSCKDIEEMMLYFVISGFMVGILLIVRMLMIYFMEGRLVSYNSYTGHLHPSYFSMYYIFYLSYFLFSFNKMKDWVRWLGIVLFSINIFLSSSKAGFLAFVLLCFVYVVKKYKLKSIFIILLFVGIFYYVFYQTNYLIFISDRIKSMQEMVVKFAQHDSLKIESNSIRLFAWRASLDVISKNWLIGVGSGEVHRVLNEYYNTHHLEALSEKNINAHNTFFQIMLATGMLGLVVFLYLFMSWIIQLFRYQQVYLGWYVVIALLCFFSTESVWETQAGTIFWGALISFSDKYIKLNEV